MPPSVFLHHPETLLHDAGEGHPERAARIEAILAHLEACGRFESWSRQRCPEVRDRELLRVHDEDYLRQLELAVERAPAVLDGGDTVVCSDSLRAARRVAGGAVQAALKVQSGEWARAFVAGRPPGHHAEHARAMGFCLYNHVAVAAEALLQETRLQERPVERVAIVDFDVHHGNGTQHLFEDRAEVFYASLHQAPLWPGTGAAGERGRGEGLGTTFNRPLPAGSGDREWSAAMQDELLPAVEAFAPDFLLVSAGFDGHEQDPLAGMLLQDESYARCGRDLAALARHCCEAKLVAVLEGGYHLDALARSVDAFLGGLLD